MATLRGVKVAPMTAEFDSMINVVVTGIPNDTDKYIRTALGVGRDISFFIARLREIADELEKLERDE